jgi:uncharacterized protein (DUF433 family)
MDYSQIITVDPGKRSGKACRVPQVRIFGPGITLLFIIH